MNGNEKKSRQSLAAIMTGFSMSGAVISALRFGLQLLKRILWESMFLLAISAWLLWLLPDFLLSRKPRQSMTQKPMTRKLPIPVREGSDIFAIMPDGSRVALEPLEAKLQAEAWSNVVMGAFVYEKTRISAKD